MSRFASAERACKIARSEGTCFRSLYGPPFSRRNLAVNCSQKLVFLAAESRLKLLLKPRHLQWRFRIGFWQASGIRRFTAPILKPAYPEIAANRALELQ